MIQTAHGERLKALLYTIFSKEGYRRVLTHAVRMSLRTPWYGEPLSVGLYDSERPTPVSECIDHLVWGPPLGLRLLCGRYVVAGVGVDGFIDAIRIRQIQGVMSTEDVLCRLHWQRALCLCLMAIARQGDYKEALIMPAQRQRFFPLGDDEQSEAIRRRMKYHYDETANALGFRWSEARQHFVRRLR